MANGLVVRDARPDERAAVRALTLAAYEEFAALMDAAAFAALRGALEAAMDRESPAERIVAEHGGALAGSVLLFPAAAEDYGGAANAAPWPELRLLAVSPDARGLGVGQALVDECVRRARAAGARDLGLHTSRSMAAALRMYERMGFVRAPRYDFHPDGAEVVWAYRLPLDGAGGDGLQPPPSR